MTTAENYFTCDSTVDPPNYVEFISNWTTTLRCDLPEPPSPWSFGWEGIAALATLAAVGLSWFLSKKAQNNADDEIKETRARQAELKAMQDRVEKREEEREAREKENAEFEKRKHAEQVVAWLTAIGTEYGGTCITVANHSEFPIWSVVVNHDAFGDSKTVIYPVMAAGSQEEINIGYWARKNYSRPDNLLLDANVKITFVDINGRTWQRPAGDVPLLREIQTRNR